MTVFLLSKVKGYQTKGPKNLYPLKTITKKDIGSTNIQGKNVNDIDYRKDGMGITIPVHKGS